MRHIACIHSRNVQGRAGRSRGIYLHIHIYIYIYRSEGGGSAAAGLSLLLFGGVVVCFCVCRVCRVSPLCFVSLTLSLCVIYMIYSILAWAHYALHYIYGMRHGAGWRCSSCALFLG